MSDDFKLPTELESIESKLLQLPAEPGSAIDRDRLMYQCGWAACAQAVAAQAETGTATGTLQPFRRSASWMWPALAGTFAATSAALAILLFSGTTNFEAPAVADTQGHESSVVTPDEPIAIPTETQRARADELKEETNQTNQTPSDSFAESLSPTFFLAKYLKRDQSESTSSVPTAGQRSLPQESRYYVAVSEDPARADSTAQTFSNSNLLGNGRRESLFQLPF